jgi:competence protein ComEC
LRWPGVGVRAFGAVGAALLAERDRWALWLPVALGTGIAIYFALPSEPSTSLCCALGSAGLVVATAAALSPESFARAFLALVAAMMIGFGDAKLRTELVAAPVLVHRVGPIGVDGQVIFAQVHNKGVRAVFRVTSFDDDEGYAMPKSVRVSFRVGGEKLVPGASVHFKAVLMPPPAPACPGDYDFGRAAWFEGLGAVGYAYGPPTLVSGPPTHGFFERIADAVEHLRWRMTERIHAVLPGSTGAIAAAIITGDRGGISEDDESALRDAGLAHVLAIAGLHMALVGLGLFWAIRAGLAMIPSIALTQPIKKWAAVAALAGAAFYLVISGAQAATTRAFIMLAMMLLAILFDRPAISMRSLALAACIILLMRPESLIEPGFQMSFAAVTGLVAVAEWEQRRARETDGVPMRFATLRRYLWGITVTSFVGSIATMPFAAFHFDRATHYAVLGNLGAMPIMGFVTMPAAAIAVILMPFGLEAAPLHVMGWGIDAMLGVGRWVSHLPGAVSIVPAWPVASLVLLSAGGLWIAFWRARWRWLGLVPAAAGIALVFIGHAPDVLIARDGRTIAFRGTDGLLRFARPPADNYSAAEWLKRDGDARTPDAAMATSANNIRCDSFGCIAKARNGETIAAVSRLDALDEDCASAALVISSVPTRGTCIGPKRVIDRFDVARNGPYAVWVGDKIVVETVQEFRGDRPWSRAPRRHESYKSSD